MDEDLSESAPEVSLEEMRRAIMEKMGWNEAELREQMEEARDQALLTITESDGTPVDPDKMTAGEKEEAILNLLYYQYIVEMLGENPLELAE